MPLLSSFGGGSARGFGVFRLMSGGTEGIFALGYNSTIYAPVTTRDKYTYAGDVVSAGTAATAASSLGSAVGNSTEGIFALGVNATAAVATRDKYTYAGDVVSAATASSVASYSGSAAGNGTTGVNI